MNSLPVLSVLFAGWILVGCSEAKKPDSSEASPQMPQIGSASSGGVRENRSRVQATVLEVVQQKEFRFHLRMRVESVDTVAGFESVAKVGDVLQAYPNFKRREGHDVDLASGENKHLLQAKSLQPGDQITANLYYRQSGTTNVVLLMDWEKP